MTYKPLKCSVPKSWIELLNNSTDNRRTIDGTQVDKTILTKTGVLTIDKSKSCDAYNILIQSEVQSTTAKRQMVDRYPHLNWKDVCLPIYTGLLDTQSREF